jgi:hypothetical protein
VKVVCGYGEVVWGCMLGGVFGWCGVLGWWGLSCLLVGCVDSDRVIRLCVVVVDYGVVCVVVGWFRGNVGWLGVLVCVWGLYGWWSVGRWERRVVCLVVVVGSGFVGLVWWDVRCCVRL